jgi:hypothetical protein
MAPKDIKRLDQLLLHALSVKDRLSPQTETDDRKDMMARIRAEFPLEKADCSTVYTCLLHIIGLYVKTKANAIKILPNFKQLIPYLFKVDSYASKEIHYGETRAVFNDSSTAVKLYTDKLFKTTAVQKQIQSIRAQERVELKLVAPFRVSLPDFLENIARDSEKETFAAVMTALESASGSRAIELINPKVAIIGMSPYHRYVSPAILTAARVRPVLYRSRCGAGQGQQNPCQ